MIIRINPSPTPKDLRAFAWVLIIGFGLLGVFCWLNGNGAAADWLWGVGTGIGSLSWIFPALGKHVYRIWMGFAVIIGGIVSRIVELVFFFGILTPVSLLFRALGRDALKLKKAKDVPNSYWVDHPRIADKKYYDHLF